MLQKRLEEYLKELPARGIPACEVIVTRHGRVAAHAVEGFADVERTRAASEDDLYFLYSSSKVLTAAAGLALYEDGRLSLSDRVSDYLPAYADICVTCGDGGVRPAEKPLLVSQLFTMTGGCDYGIGCDEIKALTARDKNASTLDVLSAYAAHPFLYEPGEHFGYSMCHDILAGVIEVASGMRFSDYVFARILRPLGITDLYYHVSDEILPRFSAEYRMNGDLSLTDAALENHFLATPAYESGGAGVITTAKEYIKFLTMLSMGGKAADGTQVLRPETVALLTENRLTPTQLEDYNRSVGNRDGYGYGLGVRVHMGEGEKNSCGTSIGEFGWGGAAGSYSLADTQEEVSVYYVQHVLSMQGFTYADHPHNVIREMVYEEIKKGNL